MEAEERNVEDVDNAEDKEDNKFLFFIFYFLFFIFNFKISYNFNSKNCKFLVINLLIIKL